jgi:hypothetical protein
VRLSRLVAPVALLADAVGVEVEGGAFVVAADALGMVADALDLDADALGMVADALDLDADALEILVDALEIGANALATGRDALRTEGADVLLVVGARLTSSALPTLRSSVLRVFKPENAFWDFAIEALSSAEDSL